MLQHNENKQLRFAAVWLGIAVLMPLAAFTLTSNGRNRDARSGDDGVAVAADDVLEQQMRFVEAGSQQWACVPLRELPALSGDTEPVIAALRRQYDPGHSGATPHTAPPGRTRSQSRNLD